MGISSNDLALFRGFSVAVVLLGIFILSIGVMLMDSPQNAPVVVSLLRAPSSGFDPSGLAAFDNHHTARFSVFILSHEKKSLYRILCALISAGYPQNVSVDIIIVVTPLLNASEITGVVSDHWDRGRCRIVKTLQPVNESAAPSLVLLLEDRMEVSPFYAFWFFHLERNRTGENNDNNNNHDYYLLSGGGNLTHPAGIAVTSGAWNRWLNAEGGSMDQLVLKAAASSLANNHSSVVFPRLDDGRVFVRHEAQSPVLPERDPKLVRAWDYDISKWMH